MKNWKAGLGGAFTAIGLLLTVSENIYIKNGGLILSAIGAILLATQVPKA